MLLRLFNDESDLVDHAKDRERAAAESRAAKETVQAADAEETNGHSETEAAKANGNHDVNGAEVIREEGKINGEIVGETNGESVSS